MTSDTSPCVRRVSAQTSAARGTTSRARAAARTCDGHKPLPARVGHRSVLAPLSAARATGAATRGAPRSTLS